MKSNQFDGRHSRLAQPLAAAMVGLAMAHAPAQAEEFNGLRFGVGISLAFTKNGVTEAELDGNKIVRATKESKRTPRVLLESHYFFQPKSGSWFCPEGNTCSHGPFVGIEPSGTNSNAVSAYALGWMLGFKFKKEDADDTSSWNIGVGYIARTGVRALGDGIEVNKPLPANDALRYREISQPGWMIISSFSF